MIFSVEEPRVQNLQARQVVHNGAKRIALYFSYSPELIQKVRKISDCRWSETMRCWHIPDTFDNWKKVMSYVDPGSIVSREVPVLYEEKKVVLLNINKKERIIYITMPFDANCIEKIRRLPGAWWHVGAKVWSVYHSLENLKAIQTICKNESSHIVILVSDFTTRQKMVHKQPASREAIPNRFIEQLKLENKSIRTIEIYVGFISQLLKDIVKDPEEISDDELRGYILEHREKKGYSESYQNQMVSAIKSFYRVIYQRVYSDDLLPRPKKGRQLPKVMPREDIERMFTVCHYQKHRMILLLLYGFGLRVGELVNLEVSHIDFERRHLAVIAGKGRKDRILPIPGSIVNELKKYLKSFLPDKYLLTGQYGGPYSTKSAQNVVKMLARKAGIEQTVTPHMIRHCYATHMLERGTDLRYIQGLLGHQSSKTTEIYTHVSMRKLTDLGSPLDDIKF